MTSASKASDCTAYVQCEHLLQPADRINTSMRIMQLVREPVAIEMQGVGRRVDLICADVLVGHGMEGPGP